MSTDAPTSPSAPSPQFAPGPTSAPPTWPAPTSPAVAIPMPVGANGFAIASLVLGIVWQLWIGSILAVVFGHIALSQIEHSQGRQSGRGFAIAGLVLGWFGVAILALFIVAAAVGNP